MLRLRYCFPGSCSGSDGGDGVGSLDSWFWQRECWVWLRWD